MLQHLATRLFAATTFFRAGLHMRIVRKLFAGFRTIRTRSRTRFTNQRRERSLSRDDLRSGRTNDRAVTARHQRTQMILFSIGHLASTMSRTVIAFSLTIRTGLGTRPKSFMVLAARRGLFLPERNTG